jgi:NhaA family Na+:H+ antiporter
MSLFIAGLAFAEPLQQDAAKFGVLAASVLAGVVGFLLLRGTSPATPRAHSAVEDLQSEAA